MRRERTAEDHARIRGNTIRERRQEWANSSMMAEIQGYAFYLYPDHRVHRAMQGLYEEQAYRHARRLRELGSAV